MKKTAVSRGRACAPPARRGAPRRGIVLVASVGILGVISVMGLAFATVMRLESRAAHNYLAAVRAEFVARAGVEDAIARLRIVAREGAEFPFQNGRPAEWSTWLGTAGGTRKISFASSTGTNLFDDDGDDAIDEADERAGWNGIDDDGDGAIDETDEKRGWNSQDDYPLYGKPDELDETPGDKDGVADDFYEKMRSPTSSTGWIPDPSPHGRSTYTLRIEDAASKINVNAGDNLGTMLDNLCRAIGPPLRAADQEALEPKWLTEMATAMVSYFQDYRNFTSNRFNGEDSPNRRNFFYRLNDGADGDMRPICATKKAGYKGHAGVRVGVGQAVYGDGYAIAGHRALYGAFLSIEEVRNSITWIERGDGDGDGIVEADRPDEMMEVETKFAALRPYLTVDSWCDTDQIGYGKFESVKTLQYSAEDFRATALIDRNRTWNVHRNPIAGMKPAWVPDENVINEVAYYGELRDCLVAIVTGVGKGQLKTIAGNSIDTIFLDDTHKLNSTMRVPPNQDSCYIIIGKDAINNPDWRRQLKLYARQPLSFHRAPINVNTAPDKVLVASLMGLQTNWGVAGYFMRGLRNLDGGFDGSWDRSTLWADAFWQCPSVLSIGRDKCNARLEFKLPCPNDTKFDYADDIQQLHGHSGGKSPYCFFCSFGHLGDRSARASKRGHVNEAHYLAWQIMKEREQTKEGDLDRNGNGAITTDEYENANGYGPFKGWDDLYFRVFRPWERGLKEQLNVEPFQMVRPSKQASQGDLDSGLGHRGIARLLMANFNSNTNILKFQPNIEWLDRWGANFTDLWVPQADLIKGTSDMAISEKVNLKLRVRPAELLDKTDLNIGTTEFSFDSGGIFEIESVGRIYDKNGVVAERKYSTLVRIYNVWRESTQREFARGDISPALPDLPGTQRAGQYALDHYRMAEEPDVNDDAAKKNERKGLCTYPEPIVPRAHEVGSSANASYSGSKKTAKLAWNPENPDFQPAGYDGHILLATNTYWTIENWDRDEIGFYNSFTGDVVADLAKDDPEPGSPDRFDVDGDGNSTEWIRVSEKEEICPLDMVSLLGALDSPDFDMEPTFARVRGGERRTIDGEGRDGDLRPDGVHMGVCGADRLDGSFEYMKDNYAQRRGAFTMWVKPQWHHGTIAPASLPIEYLSLQDGKVYDDGRERGTTRCMRRVWDLETCPEQQDSVKAQKNWPCVFQLYDTKHSRGVYAIGYVRDRFEYEFFSGVGQASGWDAPANLKLSKAGDPHSSLDDGDWKGDLTDYSSPDGSLQLQAEITCDDATFIPGWLGPDSRPYYQMCPFRWFFIGILWNYEICAPGGRPVTNTDDNPFGDESVRRDSYLGRGEGLWHSHRQFGQPQERSTITEGLGRTGNINAGDQDGNEIVGFTTVYGHKKDRTAPNNLTNVMRMAGFVNTMHTFWKMPRAGIDDEGEAPANYHWADIDGQRALVNNYGNYDLEDWASEQYGTMQWRDSAGIKDTHMNFGVNKVPNPGNHYYQAFWGGMYATIDEFKIHLTWDENSGATKPEYIKDVRRNFAWAQEECKVGRYYFPKEPATPDHPEYEPNFHSQDLYMSEMNHSYAFGPNEEREDVELGTVRWTIFTPYFCLNSSSTVKGSGSMWTFPYDSYFSDATGEGRHEDVKRYPPYQLKLAKEEGQGLWRNVDTPPGAEDEPFEEVKQYGVESRYSSQRGAKVQIEAFDSFDNELKQYPEKADNKGDDPEFSDRNYYYDPEAWTEIIKNYRTREHVKGVPADIAALGKKGIRYKLWLRLSQTEYDEAVKGGMFLLDSPVFEDITITYMRRPQILQWREVAE